MLHYSDAMTRWPLKALSDNRKVALRVAFSPIQDVIAWPFSRSLDALARIFGTDKASTQHAYTQFYKRHLPPRGASITLLEIGIGGTTSGGGYATRAGGQSLRMWRRYFPQAKVVGLDIRRKAIAGRRLHIEIGSQADPAVLDRVAASHGPFDVIIDDGSHMGDHVIFTLRRLFPHLKPGGVYVVEDLAVAYSEEYGGGTVGAAGTQVSLLKNLVDDVLRRHWPAGQGRTAFPVAQLHVYDEIAFIVKEGAPHPLGGHR